MRECPALRYLPIDQYRKSNAVLPRRIDQARSLVPRESNRSSLMSSFEIRGRFRSLDRRVENVVLPVHGRPVVRIRRGSVLELDIG